MFGQLFLIIPLLFSFPSLVMTWVGGEHQQVSIALEAVDPEWRKCVENGLEARYRLEIRICRLRDVWGEHCLPTLVETRSLIKDPLTSTYRVTSDLLYDKEEPEKQSIETFNEAIASMTTPHLVSIADLTAAEPDVLSAKRVQISARVISSCRGEVNPMLRRLSQFLTLGIIDLQDKTSSWTDFVLKKW